MARSALPPQAVPTDRRSAAEVLGDVARRPVRLLWLVLVWFALWGDLSWANLLGGLAVGVGVLLAAPPSGRLAGAVAPLPALAYLAVFVRDLVVATAEVAVQVFWPVDRLRPAVLEVHLASTHPELLALVANTISLTPGTLTIEVDSERAVLWVHVLHLADRPGAAEDIIEQAHDLERRGARALRVELPATARVERPATPDRRG